MQISEITPSGHFGIKPQQGPTDLGLSKKIQATYKMLVDKINMTLDDEGVQELEVYLRKLRLLAQKKGVELI